jgi:hypothetical protein
MFKPPMKQPVTMTKTKRSLTLGAPTPLGAPKPPMGGGRMPFMQDGGPGGGAEPDGAEPATGGGAVLSADTIGYHPEPHNCGNCKHNLGGTCEVMAGPVTADGGCDVWEGGEQEEEEPEQPDMEAAPGGTPESGGRGMYGNFAS